MLTTGGALPPAPLPARAPPNAAPRPQPLPPRPRPRRPPLCPRQVAFGVAGLATPGETYGLFFVPRAPPPPPPLSPVAGRPGCFTYTAGQADYASKVALAYGISIREGAPRGGL